MALTVVPSPRRSPGASDRVRRFYENELGWATVPGKPGAPVRLRTGVRFDVLDVPAEAGLAALRHLAAGSPVAVRADRMRLLVAAGSAEELPGLLDWLEWGPLRPDIRAIGTGGDIAAPAPPGTQKPGPRGAAVWLRPPEPGCEVERVLPTVSALGGDGGAAAGPSLVRVVDTMATQCHRIRLRGADNQPLAFS